MISSDSHSDSSDGSELSNTRANILQEQQQLKKEILAAKQQVQRYEHDLEIAQNAYNIGEIAFLQRAKKLAQLFGGTIKSDEELIEKVQNLMKEADENEQKAKELRVELEEYQNAKQQNDTLVQTQQNELQKQKDLLSKKKADLAKAQEVYENATNDLNFMQQKTTDLINSLSPVAAAIGCTEINDEFFRILEQRLSSYNPDYDKPLKRIAKAANVSYRGLTGFNPGQFFDKVVDSYNELQNTVNQESNAQNEVKRKMENIDLQIKQKENETETLKQAIAKLEDELNNKKSALAQKDSEQIAEMKKKAEIVRAKELEHVKRVLEKIGAPSLIKDNTSLDDSIDILCSVIMKLARKVQERKQSALARDSHSQERLQRNIHVIEDTADVIIKSNRLLLKKYK